MKLFHGSENMFKEFDLGRIREHATTEGVGFYLTDNEDIASSYTGSEGYLHVFDFKGKKDIGYDNLKVTNEEWIRLLMAIEEENEILSNFGDVNYEGLGLVLSKAMELLSYNTNDMDKISEICNVNGGIELPLRLMYEVLGYDHCIAKPDWGKQDIYLVFANNALEYLYSKKRFEDDFFPIFDERAMKDLVERDFFIGKMYKDLCAKNPNSSEAEMLEIVFNSVVYCDSGVAEEYYQYYND